MRCRMQFECVVSPNKFFLLTALLTASIAMAVDVASENCGKVKVLTERQGVIQTPNFPNAFSSPIRCRWIIDASSYPDSTIYVYFTQLFVTSGLHITEYAYYDVETQEGVYGTRIFNAASEDVLKYEFSRTNYSYLVIDFNLDVLQGNHLRVLYHLLDVYGFNFTYEITQNGPREERCTVSDCSLVGHCYARSDFSGYRCSCFPGFFGKNCGYGPLCQPDMNSCSNGATCRYAGETTVVCECTEGFTGSKCDMPLTRTSSLGCGITGMNCILRCPYGDNTAAVIKEEDTPCGCHNPQVVTDVPDHFRYTFTARVNVINLSTGSRIGTSTGSSWPTILLKPDVPPGDDAQNKLLFEVARYFRKGKLSKLEDLQILNVTKEEGNIMSATFQLLAGKSDSAKIRESAHQMSERGIFLNSSQIIIKHWPSLHLIKISSNLKDNTVLENEEFILSCVAQGSPHVSFAWYKDGIPVNVSISLRGMWSQVVPLSAEKYSSMLAIERADVRDAGVYTCQVTDVSVEYHQQCDSVSVSVLQPPKVTLKPMSISVEKGQNVSIKCLSTNEFYNGNKFGYTWLQNGEPVLADVPRVYWEDLYRGGSILYLNNIQKSATYGCAVNAIGSRAASIYVEALNTTEMMAYCEKDGLWPSTGPGNTALQECPLGYSENAIKRLCKLTSQQRAEWQTPDYSDCVSNELSAFIENFRALTLGYQDDNVTADGTLFRVSQLMHSRPSSNAFLPGEAEPYVKFLEIVYQYLYGVKSAQHLENSTVWFYDVVNNILKDEHSIVNVKVMLALSELIKKWIQLWLSVCYQRISQDFITNWVRSSRFADDGRCVSISVIVLLENSTAGLVLRSAENANVNVTTVRIRKDNEQTADSFARNATFVTVTYNRVSYRLIPKWVSHTWRDKELVFEKRSPAMQLFFGEHLSRNSGIPYNVDFEFDLWPPSLEWVVCCGHLHSFGYSWILSSCHSTPSLSLFIIRCPPPPEFSAVAVFTAEVPVKDVMMNRRYHLVVVVGCSVCLLQCLLLLSVLISRWCSDVYSCAIYLNVQTCFSVAAMMVVFLYAIHEPSGGSYAYILASLQVFSLTAISSHVSALVILYADLAYPQGPDVKCSAVAVITASPLLLPLFVALTRRITGEKLTCWWLCQCAPLFYVHLMVGVILSILFFLLYWKISKSIANAHVSSKILKLDHRKKFRKWVSFLWCTLIVFVTTMVVIVSSIIYVNVASSVTHFVFGGSSASLGTLLMVLYIPKRDKLLSFRNPSNSNSKGSVRTNENCSLELKSTLVSDAQLQQHHLKDGLWDGSIAKPRKSAQSQSSASEDGEGIGCTSISHDLIVDCPCDQEISPNVERRQPVVTIVKESHQSQTSLPDNEHQEENRVSNGGCYPMDVLKTRVCVELGVVKSPDSGESSDDTLLMCSVDVQPCPGHILQLNELKFTAMNTTTGVIVNNPAATDILLTTPNVQSENPNVLDKISQDLDYLLNRSPKSKF